MAKLIKPNGEVTVVRPSSGKEFTLEELQQLVGGYIEMVRTLSGKLMFVNEDGLRLELPLNLKATMLAGLYPHQGEIVGTAIICEPEEVS